MPNLFRQLTDNNLSLGTQNNPHTFSQITPQQLSLKLNSLLNSKNSQTQKQSKSSQTIKKPINKIKTQNNSLFQQPQSSQLTLQTNQLYINSLNEVSTFIIKLSYSHPGIVLYPKYQISNVIGFYQISKHLCHYQNILPSKQLRTKFNQQVITLLFTQKIIVYKDIFYRIQQSAIFKNFIQQLFSLVEKRIQMMLERFGLNSNKRIVEVCKSHVRTFIQRYQMTESMRYISRYQYTNQSAQNYNNQIGTHNMSLNTSQTINISELHQSQQLLNIISIDEVIICFAYLIYRNSRQNSKVAMWKLNQTYFKQILRWNTHKKDCRIVQLYNNCYLKLYLAGKLQKIEKSYVIFDEIRSKIFLAEIIENQQTVLDYFASSLQN